MNYEIIGTVGSIVVLISFLMVGERKIRIINIIGAMIFVVYGILIHAFSVAFLNSALVLIHCVKLYKGRKIKGDNVKN